MKTWLFALVQSAIAALGLVAYFWADNVAVASAAAVLAALVAIAQPLISAHKQQKLGAYQDRQFAKSLRGVDKQVKELLKDVIEPPLPHRATVAAGLHSAFSHEAAELLAQYDAAIEAISNCDAEAPAIAEEFADAVDPWSAGPYLQGLAALSSRNTEAAYEFFSAAKNAQSAWISPWIGWATTAYRLGRIDEIREGHPHINGVELLPYGAGDEQTFISLGEDDREELTAKFQQAATALANYYAIAEYMHSKEQIATSRDEFKRVA